MSEPTEKEPVYVNKDIKEEIAVTIDAQKPVVTTVVKEKEEPETPDIDLSKIVEGARVSTKSLAKALLSILTRRKSISKYNLV